MSFCVVTCSYLTCLACFIFFDVLLSCMGAGHGTYMCTNRRSNPLGWLYRRVTFSTCAFAMVVPLAPPGNLIPFKKTFVSLKLVLLTVLVSVMQLTWPVKVGNQTPAKNEA